MRRKSQSGQEEVAPVDIIKWSSFETKIRGGDKGVRTRKSVPLFSGCLKITKLVKENCNIFDPFGHPVFGVLYQV